jgi:hypothetical protein
VRPESGGGESFEDSVGCVTLLDTISLVCATAAVAVSEEESDE